MKVPIVLCVDSKGIKFINPLIRSIKDNVPNNEIHLITDSDYETESVYKRYHFESPIKNSIVGRLTGYMWVRLWIDEIIPDLKKFIYLDFDCIVTDDISDMLDGDDWVAKGILYPRNPMLCSGVMAFNFNNPITKELMTKMRSHAHYKVMDESVINTYLMEHVVQLPQSYMVMDHYKIINGSIKPKIIHFYGDIKPWINPIQYYFKYCNLESDIINLNNINLNK